MIHIQAKPYQVVLWRDGDRTASEPAERLDFDKLEDAERVFHAQRAAGTYYSGILLEWRKHSNVWNLLEQFP